jgi:hypothetical protein
MLTEASGSWQLMQALDRLGVDSAGVAIATRMATTRITIMGSAIIRRF